MATLTLNWIEDAVTFHRPFNVGGIGILQTHRPFDVVTPVVSVGFHRQFEVHGSAELTVHRSFDVIGPASASLHRPFNVISLTTSPGIGYPSLTPSHSFATTLSVAASPGDTAISVTSQSGMQIGDLIRIGTELHSITGLNSVDLGSPMLGSWPIGTAVTSVGGLLDGLLIFDKAGVLLGSIPVGYFSIDQAPSRVINDHGSMAFHMNRLEQDGTPNPYLDLIFDDRLVLVADELGGEPWAGTITTQDWGESRVQVQVEDVTTLWGGPQLSLNQSPTGSVTAAQVYQAVLDLMNIQRGTDGEITWGAAITGSKLFHGDLNLTGTPAEMFTQIQQRSMTEYTWRAALSGSQLVLTLLVADLFTAGSLSVADGDGGNVAANPRLLVDPGPLINAVRVRGKALDLSQPNDCGNSGLDCFDWLATAGSDITGSTQVIPEGYASVDPGPHRRREEMRVDVDWGMAAADQQASSTDILSRATAIFGSFLRAYHDRYGRPFHEGWSIEGLPSDLERFLNTSLGWRSQIKLVEYQGQPAALSMYSDAQQQALLTLYDIPTQVQTVRRVWFNETGASILATLMSVHGYTWVYTVIGGVITGRLGPRPFDHSSALVGPPVTYMWPAGDGHPTTTYHTLRRVVSLSEDGALTEAMFFDTSVPSGPTSGVYYDPPFNTQPIFTRPTVGDAPYKTFSTVTLPSGVLNDDFISKVYDFELRNICNWDPRRDGIGALLSKETIVRNAPTTSQRWNLVPWGDGSGSTVIVDGLTATDTVLLVENAFVLPTTFPYEATIGTAFGAEDVLVTAGSGPVLTVQRGYNGTTAIVHEPGEPFAKKTDCVPTSTDTTTEQIVPWPDGQAWAEAILERLSHVPKRLTVQITNELDEWSGVTYGTLADVDIASEGPPPGIVGTWRVLGWAPNYDAGTMELMVEEYFP